MTADRRQEAIALRIEGLTYRQIGAALGVSAQRAGQYLRPSTAIVNAVMARSGSLCEGCGIPCGRSGHIHHRQAAGMTAETYNAAPNLVYLCNSCHQSAHRGLPKSRALVRATADGYIQLVSDVRRRRLALGWSQEELARRAGVSKGSVQNVEAGLRGTLGTTMLRLAEAFECSFSDLFWTERVGDVA